LLRAPDGCRGPSAEVDLGSQTPIRGPSMPAAVGHSAGAAKQPSARGGPGMDCAASKQVRGDDMRCGRAS
jgi:hypothetical protein